MRSKARTLREKLAKGGVVLVGAHNGITAKLVENEGFDGIWASGFEISTAHGVPDASLLDMSEMALASKVIAGAVSIPVVADCDSGFGDLAVVARMMREYEAIGAAGVCIEDNMFPKMNSFYPGVRKLADPEEHAARIRAAKGAQRDRHSVVIARTEAFIAGLGLEAALERARCYEEAGADAILVHSRSKDPGEVLSFAARYDGRLPLVCVPTTYHSAGAGQLFDSGYSMVIYANHVMRSAITAVQANLSVLKREMTTNSIEEGIVAMSDIRKLVGCD